MVSAITAIGTANPAFKHAQQPMADLVAELLNLNPVKKRILKSIYNSSGIETRYSVLANNDENRAQFFSPSNTDFPSTAARMELYRDNAVGLASAAIKNCLIDKKEFTNDMISHLITVSCTGMYAPGLDIEIIQHFKLKPTVQRTAINFMGCYAAFNGLKAADAICKADPSAKVLIVCIELCTIHFQLKEDIDNLIANAIFADGAGCVLIEANPQQDKYLNLDLFHCDLLPQSNNEMAWHIGNHGFDMILTSYVPQAIESGIAAFATNLIQQRQLDFQAIDYYAIHPGGLKILQACEKALNLDKEKNNYSYEVLREFGNMSSATILFVLKKIWHAIQPKIDNNKTIFSCAFGPGLTLESMLLTVGTFDK